MGTVVGTGVGVTGGLRTGFKLIKCGYDVSTHMDKNRLIRTMWFNLTSTHFLMCYSRSTNTEQQSRSMPMGRYDLNLRLIASGIHC